MENGIEFDPGFGPYIMALQGTIEYLYNDINRYKNFSQRKMKFRQYYKKILEVFNNNLGFYIGCLMWASYIKKQSKQKILNNHCFGKEFNKEDNTAETDYMIKFVELFPKDMKYFIGQDFKFDDITNKILYTYKEFLDINMGFVNSEYNTDIKLPDSINQEKAPEYKEKIDNAINEKNLSKLLDYKELIFNKDC